MNIKTTYSLDENDYLSYQLHSAATNKRIKAKRKKEWIFTAITFISLGMLLYSNDNRFLGNYFIGATILTIFCFPFYSRWRYKNHYLRHIKETYKNIFGKEVTLIISDSILQTNDDSGQSSVNISQLIEINETGQHFFLKMLSGQSVIVPKNKLDNLQEFSLTVKEISVKLNIKHNIDINWKWK